ncbi:putative bifunctional diguanylate cyclase/phosphodiesterase [Variovorax sp. ZT4R33]|uniref:putative bifunctional diguanylate cyclase/phosphodiesterase n=1 Tax=Variovorax sp. ZT4R33 TaxID=3443743 RepID=UPI003F483C85
MNHSALSPPPSAPADAMLLARMVRVDQLVSVRRSVQAGMPISIVLALTTTLVAIKAGRPMAGLSWLMLALTVNVVRMVMNRRLLERSAAMAAQGGDPSQTNARWVEWQLRSTVIAAAVSGCVWALVPLLCDGYTSPQTVFHLTVVCGICAGAVTYSSAYAPAPLSFILPTLLSVMVSLVLAGGFENASLAAMVLLYFVGLTRGALVSEKAFRAGSRLKNEATQLAVRLHQAHQSLQASTQALAHRASHDFLTGLLNREGFTQAVAAHLAAHPRQSHCLLLLDLDGFKAVNDAFGHPVGDQVLKDVAQWLAKELDGLHAVLGRWGGDEFAILYRPQAEPATPEALAETLIASIPFATAHSGGHLGVSIGISKFELGDAAVEFTDMISLADEGLYEAKRAGRNRYQVVDEALHLRLATRRDVERDLLQAIEARTIELWYQPILERDSGRIHSLEALLRWNHPRHGRISPEQVVFAAASTGIAENLLRYILEEICGAMQQMDAPGSALAGVPVAMNVSPREMAQLAVDEIVLGTLAARGIATCRLQIEITEEVALDTHATRGRLSALSAAGVAIAVDDFGVGYSSLASLRSDYVKQVKIDRSFIDGLASSPGNAVLVNSIVQLGASLDIAVVAEGVETEGELAVLTVLECRLVQGYLFARPAPLPEVMAWAAAQPA